MENTKAKKSMGLNNKILVGIVILALSIGGGACLIGYLQYNETIKKLYNENGFVVSDIILDHIDHDKIAEYVQTWEEDAYYTDMEAYLKSVEGASGSAYIYIMVPNENHTMRYVYDSSGLKIGDSEPMSADFDDILKTYKTGKKIDRYYTRRSKKYGYLTACISPILDSNNQCVALLIVDVHMEIIVSTRVKYIIRVIAVTLSLLAIFSVLFWAFMKRSVLQPIAMIRKNAHEFAENNAQISSDELDKIKTGDELQDLAYSITSMEHSIVEYINHIQEVTAEKERIGAELNVAKRIQEAVLPRIFPPFPEREEFDLYASMDPAKEVGGDFYDFFLIDEDHLGLAIADVSGKGVPAALFMMISKTLIKNQTAITLSPKSILESVNNTLCENNEAEMFVTVWLGILEISTGIMTCANAGHEYPAIKRADGAFELFKDPHGMVCAAMEGMRYKEYELQFAPGDILFVYTDGVPEATDNKEELFGTDRMLDTLNHLERYNPDDILKGVRRSVDQFVGDAPQFDDLTMLALIYKGKE